MHNVIIYLKGRLEKLCKFINWQSKTADKVCVKPDFIINENEIAIKCNDEYYTAAYLEGELSGIEENKMLKVEAFFKNIHKTEETRFFPALIQYNEKNEQIAGDYLTVEDNRMFISLELLEETRKVTLELFYSSKGKSEIRITIPGVCFTDKMPHRIVNVATAYFPRKYVEDFEENMKTILEICDNAAGDEKKPDILIFTETAYDRGLINIEERKWISADSGAVKRIRNKAKEHGMYIIFGIHEDEEGRRYNTNLIISPEGEIVGKYRKTHLTYEEYKSGIIPGDELPVFDLSFGRIGMLICWDTWFPEAARVLVSKGAEMIFISTAGNPQSLFRARANENGVYTIVSGVVDDLPSSSCIFDEDGELVTCVSDSKKGYAVATLDFDEHKYSRYLSFANGYGRNLYPLDKRSELYKKEGLI